MTSPILRVVDLSHPVENGMQVYPGDPGPAVTPASTLDRDGVNVLHLSIGTHTGTHVDAPYHFLADGARVDALDLSTLLGPATVVDVRGLSRRSPIPWDRVAPHVDRAPILVLHTGWSRHWGTPAYADHPFLDAATAARIVAAGVRTVGIDALSVDPTPPSGEDPDGYPAHHVLLGAGCAIVENLTNLAAVDFPDPLLSVLPLRVRGGDGAPARAVALRLAPVTVR